MTNPMGVDDEAEWQRLLARVQAAKVEHDIALYDGKNEAVTLANIYAAHGAVRDFVDRENNARNRAAFTVR